MGGGLLEYSPENRTSLNFQKVFLSVAAPHPGGMRSFKPPSLCVCEKMARTMVGPPKSLSHEEHVFANRTASNRALASILGG